MVLAVARSRRRAGRAVEREHAIGVDVGRDDARRRRQEHRPTSAAASGLHYTYGLTDAFNLVADAAWSLVALNEVVADSTTPHTRPTNLTNVDVGLAYVLDVLRWVPWGAAVGGYALQGGTIDGVKVLPGAALAVGPRLPLQPQLVASASTVRQHMLFTEMSTYPSFTQVLRAVRVRLGLVRPRAAHLGRGRSRRAARARRARCTSPRRGS